ncbi:hypothetical protein BC827DRAFT_103992 [Russula dissimulans]|nr:hypothetical protein BC827DRAFT_103992 [Russula dissimulans]
MRDLYPPHSLQDNETGPLSHDYFKRAVYRAAPSHFQFDFLPVTKFGRSFRFGLRIYPILSDKASISTKGSNLEYNIWRSWDDYLWFQETLELRYAALSRQKRQRLQAGKGIKKDGLYLHDRASSFESLPPGPDPKSVAKSIHEYLPKLTKRRSFFRAGQETADQRQKEVDALLTAFFQPDVPMLIRELRDDRVIRDFFGYWRRDYDLAMKVDRQRPKTAQDDGTSVRSFVTSFVSTSNVSLPLRHDPSPPVSTFIKQTPRSISSSRRPRTADAAVPLSDAGSRFSDITQPLPSPGSQFAPARSRSMFPNSSEDGGSTQGRKASTSSSDSYRPSSPSVASSMTLISRPQVNSREPKSSSPLRDQTFNVSADFPLFLSSSTRDLLPSSRPPHSPTYVTPGLGTLPEETEPCPSVPTIRPPTQRTGMDAPVSPGGANRQHVVWPDTDEASSSEDVPERELLTPVDGTPLNMGIVKLTSSSSMSPSIALLDHSLQSRCSCWRSSSEHAGRCSVHSDDPHTEVDFSFMGSTDAFSELECSISPPTTPSNSSTLRRSFSSCRRRSLSQSPSLAKLVPTDAREDDQSDYGEETLEAYFGGPVPFFTENEQDSVTYYDGVPSDLPLDVPYDTPDSPVEIGFPIPRERRDYIDGPSRALDHPSPRSSPPIPPQMSSAATPISHRAEMEGVLFVKAVLDDAIVILRARCDESLAELRRHLLEKFARSGGVRPRGPFALEYAPPVVSGPAGRRAGKYVSTISSVSASSVDWDRAIPLRTEEDWANAVARCGSKITLRVSSYPTPL